MDLLPTLFLASPFAPVVLMLVTVLAAQSRAIATPQLWRTFNGISVVAVVCTVVAVFGFGVRHDVGPWFVITPLGVAVAILVQLLGSVIGAFSARYLQGEPMQRSYVTALAGVLAAVQLLLLADHWLLLIAAWALVGVALQPLLCFYRDRPFALLAAHKKRLSDRLADVLLIAAAALAWWNVGSGSLSALNAHIASNGVSVPLQVSAVLLVLAVALRMAMMPVHGWLIQVMEAPTPVSALLHAGVINLGGFVLIRFAPLLEQAAVARWLLVALGLATAVLAGLVMLTRISIKVRLAWSTVAQMGFMALECGLGLYTLAALHLVGHSLYKAHAFLSASSAVRQTRLQIMRGVAKPIAPSLWFAPLVAVAAVLLVQSTVNAAAWPWWWSALLGFAWAPLLWLSSAVTQPARAMLRSTVAGLLIIAGLTGAALLGHLIPLGLDDTPNQTLGLVALAGAIALYVCLALLQTNPQRLEAWRRWSYAGFYVDEYYTRLALWLWPTRWTPVTSNPKTLTPLNVVTVSARQ
jgi:NAD(P)H-quinone oxidoreductase subunit 5